MLLISGGSRDPSIRRLISAAEHRRCEFATCLFDAELVPSLSWDLDSDVLCLQGRQVRPEALFVRHDVFNAMSSCDDPVKQDSSVHQADNWQSTWRGWLLTHPEARVVNRRFLARIFSKPQQLIFAARAGLRVPATLIGNDLRLLRERAEREACIAKPVHGGHLTTELGAALADCPVQAPASLMPAIVQRRLIGPEYRIFLVGPATFSFRVDSPLLDYRADHSSVNVVNADITAPELSEVEKPLRVLAEMIGLDFCAADFKTDPLTGELIFLEVNEQPMFALFDEVCGGRLCDSLLDSLVGEP